MTATTTKPRQIARARALRIAHEAVGLLSRVCERIEIAGSLRRGKAEVGDVELLAVPRTRPGQLDLFGGGHGEVDELHERVESLLGAGLGLERRDMDGHGRGAFGERFKALTLHGVPLDLFVCKPPAQWGVLHLIRTGSAQFSHRFVMPRAQGGCLPIGFRVESGVLRNVGEQLATPEETDVFRAVGLPFLPPERRTHTVRLVEGFDGSGWVWFDPLLKGQGRLFPSRSAR